MAPIGPHVNENEKKKIVKNRKLKISKIQNSTFVRTPEKKIQRNMTQRVYDSLLLPYYRSVGVEHAIMRLDDSPFLTCYSVVMLLGSIMRQGVNTTGAYNAYCRAIVLSIVRYSGGMASLSSICAKGQLITLKYTFAHFQRTYIPYSAGHTHQQLAVGDMTMSG